MAKFHYKAINPDGKMINGTIEAPNADTVQNQLAAQGNIPTEIKKVGDSSKKDGGPAVPFFARFGGVKLPDLLIFTKQINTLLRAGISISKTLEVLEEQSENPLLKNAINRINDSIHGGDSLHKSFRKHPGIFNNLYCSLVQAGEISGSLPTVLDRLAYIMEHEHKVREDVKGALAYPKMVVFALLGAFFFLLNFVIPKFVGVFESAKLELPMPTKICIILSNGIQAYWPIMLAGAAGTVFGFKYITKTRKGELIWDRILLKMPIIGHLFVKSAMSRFSSILSILMASGVGILDSLDIISGTIGNAAIAKDFEQVKVVMSEGGGISRPLREAKSFPPMVVNMVAIGEESGSLEEMLKEIAAHYDDEVQYAVKGLAEAIGPILIVTLTSVVGFFALAIFLPMWDLTQLAK